MTHEFGLREPCPGWGKRGGASFVGPLNLTSKSHAPPLPPHVLLFYWILYWSDPENGLDRPTGSAKLFYPRHQTYSDSSHAAHPF